MLVPDEYHFLTNPFCFTWDLTWALFPGTWHGPSFLGPDIGPRSWELRSSEMDCLSCFTWSTCTLQFCIKSAQKVITISICVCFFFGRSAAKFKGNCKTVKLFAKHMKVILLEFLRTFWPTYDTEKAPYRQKPKFCRQPHDAYIIWAQSEAASF